MKVKKFIEKLKIFEGRENKRVLFLENGNSFLTDDLNLFKDILIENKIETCILFPLEKIPMNIIKEYINEYDIFVFQTTWTSEISQVLLKSMDTFYPSKVIIDVYLREPHIYENYSKLHTWVNIQTDDTDNFENWEVEILEPDCLEK